LTARSRRVELVNTLGNLTLITGYLNPSLSNSGWATKRPELLKFAMLNLTQYFHGAEADTWDETAIEKRAEHLAAQLVMIWPDVRRLEGSSDDAASPPPSAYFLQIGDLSASAIRRDRGLLVLAGSHAAAVMQPSLSPGYQEIREKLIAEGALKPAPRLLPREHGRPCTPVVRPRYPENPGCHRQLALGDPQRLPVRFAACATHRRSKPSIESTSTCSGRPSPCTSTWRSFGVAEPTAASRFRRPSRHRLLTRSLGAHRN